MGVANAAGNYPPASIYRRVAAELERFDSILREADEASEAHPPCD